MARGRPRKVKVPQQEEPGQTTLDSFLRRTNQRTPNPSSSNSPKSHFQPQPQPQPTVIDLTGTSANNSASEDYSEPIESTETTEIVQQTRSPPLLGLNHGFLRQVGLEEPPGPWALALDDVPMADVCSSPPSLGGSVHSSEPPLTPSTNPSTPMDLSDAPDHTESIESSPPGIYRSFDNISHGLLEVQSHSQKAAWKSWGSGLGGPRQLELEDITEAFSDN